MIVVGIDPGLASLGVAMLRLTRTDEQLICLDVGVTKKAAAKHGVYASDDNDSRARALVFRFRAKLRELLGFEFEPVCAMCFEAASYPRNASSAAKTALARGAFVGFAATLGAVTLSVTPQNLKLAITGKKTASKEEVQAALEHRFPTAVKLRKDVKPKDLEHCYDALGAAVACLDSEAVRLARSVI